MTSQPTTDDVDMNLCNDGSPTPTNPPAHVAARFVRKSTSRRRSSAHSSRCSSLSSRHSRSSALSCHGGPRSTHIAQHLRRASIIESRKQRLADRAAHAEQVRLRAAAAKAVPRSSNTEEKALAAQAAREKLLAEITARCEEEVRRAKKVAEEVREKKEAEYARRRDEMEEKFAEAARRRSMYQAAPRRSRTTSLAAVEERKINPIVLKKIGQTAAAKVIQRTWRAWRQRKPAVNYLRMFSDSSKLGERSFEDVTKLISEDEAIEASKILLRQMELLDPTGDETSERGAIRVFLSSYIILSHPVQTFSHGGNDPQERDLVGKAQALLDLFQSCVRTRALSKSSKHLPDKPNDQLQFLFNDFNAAFHSWKSQDVNVLVDVMIGSFVNLDLIIQTTKNDTVGHVAEDYLHAVRQEQIKLLARLKRLAGPEQALTKIRAAVKKARKEQAARQRKTSSGNIPRASSDTEPMLDVTTVEPLTPPATPPSRYSRNEVPASSFVTRLGQAMTVLPNNREIAHEMQIIGTYEVQQQPWTESRRLFMNSLRQSMRESMQDGGSDVAANWSYAIAMLLRDKLMNLITPKHPLHGRLDGFLDPKLIEQQARNRMFSYESFFETIGNIISQLCSPGRDEAVQAFQKDGTSDTIDRLFSLIDIIDLMTLDHINFQFRMATRSVIEHGHEHEYGMFERALQEGDHSLDQMRTWWAHARSSVPGANLSTATLGNSVYARGLTDLVLSNTPLEYSHLPETLRLDWIRLLNLRARAFQMAATASILLTTKIRLRRNREALWTVDAERLMNTNPQNIDASRIVSMVETSHMMPDSTREGLLNFVHRVWPTAAAAVKKVKDAEHDRMNAIQARTVWRPAVASTLGSDVFTEQIATFLLKSLREHVFARLSATSTADKVRVTTSAPEILARAGMPEFVAECNSLVELLERIRGVDLKAHGRWYDEVAATVVGSS